MYVVGIRRCKNKKLGFVALPAVACQNHYQESASSQEQPTRPPRSGSGGHVFSQVCWLCLVSLFLEDSLYGLQREPFPYGKEGILKPEKKNGPFSTTLPNVRACLARPFFHGIFTDILKMSSSNGSPV